MRSRIRLAVTTALAALVASSFAGRVEAQVLVIAEQDLTFGQLTPGVVMTVAPTDVVRRAHFTIEGRGRFQVTFQLPQHLAGPAGNQIPLVFGPTDGRADIRHRITTFDPAAGVELRINPTDQEAAVYLGGRAQPAAGQRAGMYTATITVMIVQTGT